MNPTNFGVNGGWGGLRTTKNLANQFAVDLDNLNSSLGSQSDWGLGWEMPSNGRMDQMLKCIKLDPQEPSFMQNLATGELKFRFNEDWGNNYGDNGGDGNRVWRANIAVSAGTYFIVLDLGPGTLFNIAFFK